MPTAHQSRPTLYARHRIPHPTRELPFRPLLSVCLATYQHGPYIAAAIESVLAQEADFPYELIIGEDQSTDATRETCIRYARAHPDLIRLFLRSRDDVIHIRGRPTGRYNGTENMKAARGEYIARLDGDDYWTDPLKLQKQVAFLQAHPDCSVCFHDVLTIYADGSRPSSRHTQPPDTHRFGLEDVLRTGISQTSTMVFRRDALPELPDWFYRVPAGDRALSLLLAERGAIGYLHQLMSVYRAHAGGMWSGATERDQLERKLQTYDLFEAHLGDRYTACLEELRALVHYRLAVDCWLRGLKAEALDWMARVAEVFPSGAEGLLPAAVAGLVEIERQDGYQRADEALRWTCRALSGRPAGRAWCRSLCAEWGAAYAYQAHRRGDRPAVRRASWRALTRDWRILRNRGFLWRWLSAIVGPRAWATLRHLTRRQPSTTQIQQ